MLANAMNRCAAWKPFGESPPRPKTGLAALVDLWEREAQAPGAEPNKAIPDASSDQL